MNRKANSSTGISIHSNSLKSNAWYIDATKKEKPSGNVRRCERQSCEAQCFSDDWSGSSGNDGIEVVTWMDWITVKHHRCWTSRPLGLVRERRRARFQMEVLKSMFLLSEVTLSSYLIEINVRWTWIPQQPPDKPFINVSRDVKSSKMSSDFSWLITTADLLPFSSLGRNYFLFNSALSALCASY